MWYVFLQEKQCKICYIRLGKYGIRYLSPRYQNISLGKGDPELSLYVPCITHNMGAGQEPTDVQDNGGPESSVVAFSGMDRSHPRIIRRPSDFLHGLHSSNL